MPVMIAVFAMEVAEREEVGTEIRVAIQEAFGS